MIVDAGGKRTRAVADTTVLERRHVVNRLAARSHTVAGGAIVDDAGVVDECVGEAVGVVAHAAVFDGNRMRGHRGRLAGCINAVVVVVAAVVVVLVVAAVVVVLVVADVVVVVETVPAK